MTDTRPGELGSAEARRIIAEAALVQKANDERQFREHVLLTQREHGIMLQSLTDLVERHINEDDRRFKDRDTRIDIVSQHASESRLKVHTIFAIAAAFVTASGIAIAIIGLVK